MCWSADPHHRFDRVRSDPARPPAAYDPVSTPGNLRVSDADRDRVIAVLKQHTADGRLTLDEFESRVEEALTAQTGSELRAVLRELPVPQPPPARHPRVRQGPDLRLAMTVAVAVLIGLAAWQLAVFWPLVIVAFLCFGPPRRHRAHRSAPPRGPWPNTTA